MLSAGVAAGDQGELVTAGGDATVKIWDAATGALVRELRRDGARVRYFAAALSPEVRARFLASGRLCRDKGKGRVKSPGRWS